MKIRVRFNAFPLVVALILSPAVAVVAQDLAGANKKKVNSANDLPRFSYPISSPPSVLLMADDATFNAFAEKVLHDVLEKMGCLQHDRRDLGVGAPSPGSRPQTYPPETQSYDRGATIEPGRG